MKRGFTLIELLVVIAIIAILASILFPVFSRAREKARQTQCTSNLKQLATQLQIYSQENNGRYPGSDWVYAFSDISPKVFCCPSSTGTEDTDVSYGYNGLLVRTDEPAQAPKGLAEAQIKAPTEVGAFADCTPINNYQTVLGNCTSGAGANIINGGGLKGSAATVTLYPVHAGGIIASFCDGHARYFKGSDLDEKNPANAITRAFVTATQVGILDNAGGGLESPLATTAPATGITIGGDYAARPLLAAIGACWNTPTTPTLDRGFKGVFNTDGRRGTYAWANGTGAATAVIGSSSVPLATDTMVIIVAKNSPLETGSAPLVAGITATFGTVRAYITAAGAAQVFQDGVEPPAPAASTIQAYTYDSSSGSRKFFFSQIGKIGGGALGLWNTDAGNSTIVGNDLEMVDKVSTDPKGIGYCSAVFADPNVVDILGYMPVTAPSAKYFPNGAPGASAANAWRWPADVSSYDTGNVANTLVRVLYADCDSGATAGKINTNTGPTSTGAYIDLKNSTCPFFKAGYFP